jgi:hypothetical protein
MNLLDLVIVVISVFELFDEDGADADLSGSADASGAQASSDVCN